MRDGVNGHIDCTSRELVGERSGHPIARGARILAAALQEIHYNYPDLPIT